MDTDAHLFLQTHVLIACKHREGLLDHKLCEMTSATCIRSTYSISALICSGISLLERFPVDLVDPEDMEDVTDVGFCAYWSIQPVSFDQLSTF